MAYNFVDTPRTEIGDRTHLTAANVSFSEIQGFPSPTKNPATDLINSGRSRSNGQAVRTPRARNVLGGLRPGAKNEFTPLLKSAAHNRFRTEARSAKKYARDGKENVTEELVNSMLAGSTNGVPRTPAYLKVGYKDTYQTPGLPIESSVLDETSLGGNKTPGPPPAISSSTLMSTPIPAMPVKGQEGRTDQGNVLTLREQEAKLAKLDKENFNLKLKIHFLDEALKRTGTDYQQGMIKENTELKMDKTTLTYELKQHQKSLVRAEKDLEEYKLQLHDYAEKVKRRQTTEINKEELDRVHGLLEDVQRIAEQRNGQIEELNQRLQESHNNNNDKANDLKEDIMDLEQALRAKDAEIDMKDEEIDDLRSKLSQSSSNDKEVDDLHEEIGVLEAEVRQKDQEIADLKSLSRNGQDREKSTKKLRGDVELLESEIREKNEVIDEKHAELKNMSKQLQTLETQKSTELAATDGELRDSQRLLQIKDSEIRALEQRLQTARGSWDAEAEQTDARLQQKDVMIQERDEQLRESARKVDERDEKLRDLQKQLDLQFQDHEKRDKTEEKETSDKLTQIEELRNRLQKAHEEIDSVIDRTGAETQKIQRETEVLRQENTRLQQRLDARGSPTKKDVIVNEQAIQIRNLEAKFQMTLDEKDAELDELDQQLEDARAELKAMSTLQTGQSTKEELRALQSKIEELTHDRDGKDDEIFVLETSLDEAQSEKATMQQRLLDLQRELSANQSRTRTLTPGREGLDLQMKLRTLERQSEEYVQQIQSLKQELSHIRNSKLSTRSPDRQNAEIDRKLSEAERREGILQDRIAELENNLTEQQRNKGNEIQAAQEEAREFENQLIEQDKRIAAMMRKDGEGRAQLQQLKAERDEQIASLAERDSRISLLSGKEKDLRQQVDRLRDEQRRVEDLEYQLGQQQDSNTSHARKEAALRTEARESKIEIEELKRRIQQRDDQIQITLQREQKLRDGTKKGSEETIQFQEALNAQLLELENEVDRLKKEVKDREIGWQSAQKRETELRSKLKTAQVAKVAENDGQEIQQQAIIHGKELRGMSKQIQYLSAKCQREESFRRDLVFVKKWFVLQMEMYGACNQADLSILEEMGITPDMAVRERRPTLKSAVIAVIAAGRMKKMQQAWAVNKKVHETLMKKLESMKRSRVISQVMN